MVWVHDGALIEPGLGGGVKTVIQLRLSLACPPRSRQGRLVLLEAAATGGDAAKPESYMMDELAAAAAVPVVPMEIDPQEDAILGDDGISQDACSSDTESAMLALMREPKCFFGLFSARGGAACACMHARGQKHARPRGIEEKKLRLSHPCVADSFGAQQERASLLSPRAGPTACRTQREWRSHGGGHRQ